MDAIREAIRIERLSKTFSNGRKALDEIDLRVEPGEMVALIGASGSGKSTLLRHIAGFTASDAQPSQIAILGRPIQQNGRIVREVRSIRRDIGFVFQQFNLVNRLSVESNVLIGALARLPLWRRLTGRFPDAERALSMAALNEVGIGDHARERAANLSGGQQQRAALARALVQRARIVLADEPIASLDPESSRRVMEMLRTLNRRASIDGAGVAASGRHRHAVLPAHRCAASRQGGLRRPLRRTEACPAQEALWRRRPRTARRGRRR